MTAPISFFIPGLPIQKPDKKGAIRFKKGGGKAIGTKDRHVEGWEEWCIHSIVGAKQAMNGKPPIPQGIPVFVTLSFVKPQPKSDRTLYPVTRPDRSNYDYGMLNLLKGICFYDDSHDSAGASEKCWQNGPSKLGFNTERTGCHVLIDVLHETNRKDKK